MSAPNTRLWVAGHVVELEPVTVVPAQRARRQGGEPVGAAADRATERGALSENAAWPFSLDRSAEARGAAEQQADEHWWSP